MRSCLKSPARSLSDIALRSENTRGRMGFAYRSRQLAGRFYEFNRWRRSSSVDLQPDSANSHRLLVLRLAEVRIQRGVKRLAARRSPQGMACLESSGLL